MTTNDLSTKTVEELRGDAYDLFLKGPIDAHAAVITELASRALQAEKLAAEVDKLEDMAWDALGRPDGTHETSNVERLCQRVKANAALREAALLLAEAADRVCPTFDARGDASTRWSRELAPLIQSVRLIGSAPTNNQRTQGDKPLAASKAAGDSASTTAMPKVTSAILGASTSSPAAAPASDREAAIEAWRKDATSYIRALLRDEPIPGRGADKLLDEAVAMMRAPQPAAAPVAPDREAAIKAWCGKVFVNKECSGNGYTWDSQSESAWVMSDATMREAVALMRSAPDRGDALRGWCMTYGAALCPPAGSADSFGDGMRAAKDQVRAMLAADALLTAPQPPAPVPSGADSVWIKQVAEGCGDAAGWERTFDAEILRVARRGVLLAGEAERFGFLARRAVQLMESNHDERNESRTCPTTGQSDHAVLRVSTPAGAPASGVESARRDSRDPGRAVAEQRREVGGSAQAVGSEGLLRASGASGEVATSNAPVQPEAQPPAPAAPRADDGVDEAIASLECALERGGYKTIGPGLLTVLRRLAARRGGAS